MIDQSIQSRRKKRNTNKTENDNNNNNESNNNNNNKNQKTKKANSKGIPLSMDGSLKDQLLVNIEQMEKEVQKELKEQDDREKLSENRRLVVTTNNIPSLIYDT